MHPVDTHSTILFIFHIPPCYVCFVLFVAPPKAVLKSEATIGCIANKYNVHVIVCIVFEFSVNLEPGVGG